MMVFTQQTRNYNIRATYLRHIMLTVVRGIRVLVLLVEALGASQVFEGQLSSGALALANATAVVRVGGTHGQLLGGEVEQKTSGQSHVGLHGGGGGERPAGAAVALVLHGGHNTYVVDVKLNVKFGSYITG